MLKRQRPVTPVPSMPLLAEPSPLDLVMMEREHKRRRTTSTTPLDEPWMDWGHSLQAIVDHANNTQKEEAEMMVSADPFNSEYKSANTILRELHTLHQHRLLFAESGTSFLHGSLFHTPSLSSSPPKITSPTISDHPRGTNSSEIETSCNNEKTQVKERYEQRNRLLGSMFLSRRRELGLDESYP
ncbi:hypothetical protein AX15_005715 [Amanita polypyramis BW_CC]|nr:hypothetical protein AX15_005715 [Amanita polypyramis BW_CC]